ncbi:glycosyltransferase [Polaribacter tangerinus]|uniref:glycosyltransferase n=1 Tax=Polaribacter tangerinus TaxID=1920034 RepID=UPI002936E977|nr:glycosyltransferase [Polaribacter tangerinus]
MIIAILICIFVAFIGIQILYYILFSSLLFHKNTTHKSSGINGVSVLVCAKNEAENLRENIPTILNQSYHSFEVVLINDGSTDETLSVMKEFQKENDNVKIVNVENNENFWGNKKYALTLGIKAAKYETLFFYRCRL